MAQFSQFLTIFFNTPFFYLICFFIVVGYMYVVTRRDVRRILHGQHPVMQTPQHRGFRRVRMTARHSDAVTCQHCKKVVTQVAVRQTDAGPLLLCQACAKQHGRLQRAAHR